MQDYLLQNGTVFVNGTFIKADVLVAEGRISAVFPKSNRGDYIGEVERLPKECVLDVEGKYIIPGLVDTHFHGGAGADFSDGEQEALSRIEEVERKEGSLYLCPATMTLPKEQILKATKTLVKYKSRYNGTFCGFYLEGPFFHPEKIGAQNPDYLKLPDATFLDAVLNEAKGLCKVVSLAPELPGALALVAKFRNEVRFSLGHTTADGEQARRAFAEGVRRITHLYNAMPNYEEILDAAAEDGDVYAELICDGVHNNSERVLKAFSSLGPEHVILISDSMRAMGMPDGIYDLGGQKISVQGKLALTKSGAKAGSVTSLLGCVQEAIAMGVPAKDAVLAATRTPARALEMAEDCGEIKVGGRAKLLVLDDAFKLQRVL
ncbi:MAG: N-acetylglucosamine-6-phosphate deacetylase [Lachnospiraceae bacterium]|nr:N-acetylglucosamine-6-phosphate deacetylase [Lachnospiraceae bacterium]